MRTAHCPGVVVVPQQHSTTFLSRFCTSSSCCTAFSYHCTASIVWCCQFAPSLVHIERLQEMGGRQADQGAPLRAKGPAGSIQNFLDLDDNLHAKLLFVNLSAFSVLSPTFTIDVLPDPRTQSTHCLNSPEL